MIVMSRAEPPETAHQHISVEQDHIYVSVSVPKRPAPSKRVQQPVLSSRAVQVHFFLPTSPCNAGRLTTHVSRYG